MTVDDVKVGALWRNRRSKRTARVASVRALASGQYFVEYKYLGARADRRHAAITHMRGDRFVAAFEPSAIGADE